MLGSFLLQSGFLSPALTDFFILFNSFLNQFSLLRCSSLPILNNLLADALSFFNFLFPRKLFRILSSSLLSGFFGWSPCKSSRLGLFFERVVVFQNFLLRLTDLACLAVKLDFLCHHLIQISDHSLGLDSAQAATKRVHARNWVSCRRMGNAKRTIFALAVPGILTSIGMAPVTKVGYTAPEKGLRAAQVTLPSNKLMTMLLAIELAAANHLCYTSSALEILFFCSLCHVQILSTVNGSPIEGNFAVKAFIKGTLLQYVFYVSLVPDSTYRLTFFQTNLSFLPNFSCKLD